MKTFHQIREGLKIQVVTFITCAIYTFLTLKVVGYLIAL